MSPVREPCLAPRSPYAEQEISQPNPAYFQRCGQPGQQQGRRIPSLSSLRTRSICCLLVSVLLTEITQQIHSFRASGVICSHFSRATGSEIRTFRKSAGSLCTAPREIALLAMRSFYIDLIRLPNPWGEFSGAAELDRSKRALAIREDASRKCLALLFLSLTACQFLFVPWWS